MSGPLSPAVAVAASELAYRAECMDAARRWADKARSAARVAPRQPQSLPARTWAAMSIRTRTVLVMLGAESDEDPRAVAAAPWESLADNDRACIAAIARDLRGDLSRAASLF